MNYKAWVVKAAKQPMVLETIDLGSLGVEEVEVVVGAVCRQDEGLVPAAAAQEPAGKARNALRVADSRAELAVVAGQEPDPDARLYVAACGYCHYNSGATPLEVRPELALNTALTLPQPTNFIRVVLDGIGIRDGMPGVMMPGFASGLSDADIAQLAAYLRRTRTNLSAWTNLEEQVAAIRRERVTPQ